MEVRSVARFVRSSPKKVRRYAALIRGRPLAEARAALAVQPSPAAALLGKVLNSAAANAENNAGLDAEDLRVKAAYADDALIMPRVRYRARGRVERIKKRTCHITVILTDGENESV
ncbi:MAG: 50S ribosomal protein L22 [Candidatus Zipacnadales bacterium]